ncbi:MAG: TRAP transporter substrate-binding protein DctP [Bacteroidota bacterium]
MRISESMGLRRYLLTFLVASFLPEGAVPQQYVIKFATLAPEGSAWLNGMKEYDEAVREESGGRLGFRIYGNGVQGDEKVVLRKIRLGQLQGGGFTGVGMGEIAPIVRVLDTPFLFRTHAEIDFVHEKFDEQFRNAFQEGGYVLLGWAEVGFVYLFTNSPVRKPADLHGVKMWGWEDDPIAIAAFKALEVTPIPLSITDVMTSLQTGLIDGVYASPLAAIVLQWFTRVKYMFDLPLANSSGSVLVSKKMFDSLPADLQEILLRNGRKYMAKVTELSRQENERAIETLKKSGVTIIEPSSEHAADDYEIIGRTARRLLVGKLFSLEFLLRVEQAVADFEESDRAEE